ncbi:hypothetical protein B4O97_00965 [Marispirochaeta aestuarii]|uniref:Uncharacterized protein n=1 Tax=Marispirochaeta aestuarii TaxID=1963862 RepID=A0A1Y1S318_9SPIO|nr:hypothetical protein [Marispirochaeta aestuarii]ORC38359.1 hypothetical protein B4O97_00965 [Marispirochaeta aestuarii]
MGDPLTPLLCHRLRGFCCIALLLVAGNLEALEIHVAPLVVESLNAGPGLLKQKNPCKDLVRLLHDGDHQGAVSVTLLPEMKYGAPRSFLEAAELCETVGIDYLLYGYIREEEYSWDCEIKLYVREMNTVAELFFCRDATDHYDRMLDELSRKILDYFYSDVGLAPYTPAPEPDRKIFSIPIHPGYWSPGGEELGKVSIGIGRIESGVLFVPVSPLWYHGDVPWELQTGVTLSYSLATNDKEYESFLLHSMRINLPLLAAAELRNGQSIVLGGGVSMQFDILNQDRQYYGSYSAFSAAPGVFVEAAYRYRLNDSWKLGLRTALELAFFSVLQSNVVTGVYGLYEFAPLEPSIDGRNQ